jgi:hypothetical protein
MRKGNAHKWHSAPPLVILGGLADMGMADYP